ncbi:hypothetical protein S83_001385 [Arachis hypogaea]
MRILLVMVPRRIPIELKRHRVQHKFKKILMKSRNCIETGRYLVRKTVDKEAAGPHQEEEEAANIRYQVRKRSSQRGKSNTKGKKRQQASETRVYYSNFIWANFKILKTCYFLL